MLQLLCVEPARGGQRRFAQSLDAFLAECDLQNSQPIQRYFDAGALGEELDVGRITVARGDAEGVGGAGRSLDGRRQHPGGGRRRLSWPVVADESDLYATLGERGRNGQSDQTTADYDYLGAQWVDSGCLLS